MARRVFSWVAALPAIIAGTIAANRSVRLAEGHFNAALVAVIAGFSLLLVFSITYALFAAAIDSIKSRNQSPDAAKAGVLAVVATIAFFVVLANKLSPSLQRATAISTAITESVPSNNVPDHVEDQHDAVVGREGVEVTQANAFSTMMSTSNKNKVFVTDTKQTAGDLTDDEWTDQMLRDMGNEMQNASLKKARQAFTRFGVQAREFHPVAAYDSHFVYVDKRKFGIIRFEIKQGNVDVRSVRVIEIHDDYATTVGCGSWVVAPSLAEGPCADEIKKVFHVSLYRK